MPIRELSTTVRDFFRSRMRTLRSKAEERLSDHPGLIGNFRELIVKDYLEGILPERFGIGNGLVQGVAHRSYEADVVLWDKLNYPRLDLVNHSMYFAESARVVLESKSRWSNDEFADIKRKCRAVKDVVPHLNSFGMDAQLAFLESQVHALRVGVDFHGQLIFPPHIATAAFVFRGGEQFCLSDVTQDEACNIDDAWPDLMLLLGPGRVLVKEYPSPERGGLGLVRLLDAGDDGLLAFTSTLLELLSARVSMTEQGFYFGQYFGGVFEALPEEAIEFPLTRPPAGRKNFFGGE